MTKKMNLKISDDFEYKNKTAFPPQYDNKFKNITKAIQQFLNFEPLLSKYDEKMYFVLNYEKKIPKSSRLLFTEKNKIVKKEDLPWKSVRFLTNKTKILYGIPKEDWNNFLTKLQEIETNNYLLSEDNYNKAPSELKSLIGKLKKFIDEDEPIVSPKFANGIILDDFQKIDYLKDTPMLVSLIPIEKTVLTSIIEKLNIKNDVLELIEGINSLIITVKGVNKILENFPWIIKECSLYQENDLVIIDEEVLFPSSVLTKKVKLINPIDKKTVIGVIDSGNNLSGDFLKYVTTENHLEAGKISWYRHGNVVTSLIVAHDELNPTVADGLGNFCVKHFEIIGMDQISNKRAVSFDHLIKKLPEILEKNKDIKIWSLSIGKVKKDSYKRIISPIGMFLDYLATKYDVLFIVSAGNDASNYLQFSLNSPSDSFNALSVGSVKPLKQKNGKTIIVKSDYSSFGEVNGYLKPEISIFGGPDNLDFSKLKGIDVDGETITTRELLGTSFSVPKIVRMAAWLYKNGYENILEIKSKIINSAERMTLQKKSSKYGFLDLTKGVNLFDINFTTKLIRNKPYFYPINLLNIDKVSISASVKVSYDKTLGDEYSLSDLEIELYMIKKNWKKINVSKDEMKIKYATSPSEINKPNKITLVSQDIFSEKIGLGKEHELRSVENKFFSSKKKVFDLKNKKNKLPDHSWEYLIRFRRNDLVPNPNFELNKKPLEVSVVIDFQGKTTNDEFFQRNSEIIELVEVGTLVKEEIEVEV